MRLFSTDAPRSRGDNLGTIFTMPAPKNLWGPKNRPKFFAIFDNFRLWLRISPERINMQKSEKLLIICNPCHVRRKKLGVLWSTNVTLFPLINVPLNGLFSADYISALTGCCAMKFLHVLDIGQALLAHTPRGAGVPPPPPKKLIVKIKNLA